MFGVSTFIKENLQSFKILEWWENHNVQHKKKIDLWGLQQPMDMNHTILFHYQLFCLKNFCILARIKKVPKVQRIFFRKKWAQVATLWGKKKIIDHYIVCT